MIVKGHEISDVHLGLAIENCAARGGFRGHDVRRELMQVSGKAEPEPWVYSEAVNRGLQLARKAGEICYISGAWYDWFDGRAVLDPES